MVCSEDISVIIILYNPSKDDIENVCDISSRYKGVVCDNSPTPVLSCMSVNKMKYISNGGNIGIAAAQNRAIRAAEGYKYLVILDQDSRLSDDYPMRIANEYEKACAEFPKLAIMGPMLINGRSEGEYKSDIHKDKYLSDSVIFRENIIASGACVSKHVLEDVGLNEESLFIDLVDSEWCWRANSKGYFCAITPNVTITHTIGRKLIKIWKFNDVVSAPFRYYYQMRNYLWMIRRPYVPRQWKVNNGIKYIMRVFYLPFCKNGFSSWRFMWKGVFAGVFTSPKNKKQ